ncbi:hypothetical protein RCH09_000805 [Actimicrobium sp. GrIS 1.19]|uniref:hypothetical protein n=1 Tax=Actimicrobium sp. GrIS 1.19 TaxID=3071708 RepID=UPI002E090A02|nr:hypothetical protein [Actimicrobium sp. GrIS 1.19]
MQDECADAFAATAACAAKRIELEMAWLARAALTMLHGQNFLRFFLCGKALLAQKKNRHL